MRTAGSAFFVLFALVLGVAALPSAWLAYNVVAEEGFVELASPLADDAEFTGALADALAEEAVTGVGLPPELADASQPVVQDVAQGVTQLPDFNQAWQESLSRSHALTFGNAEPLSSEAAPSALFTLDVAPLVTLVTSEIGGQLGVDVPAPEQTVVNVGGTDRFAVVERAEAAAGLWPSFAVASAAGAILGLALARRRSTTLALLGVGVLLVGAGLWLAAGFAPEMVNQATDAEVADVFRDALVARAAADFQEWCLAVLAAGVLLAVAGVIGRLLGSSRR